MKWLTVGALVLAGILLIALAAAEAACTIGTTPVAFGTYDVFASFPVDAAGGVTYRCDALTLALTITLDSGGAGSLHPRRMLQGDKALTYNLYLDPARTVIWGDGTAGTEFYAQSAPLPVNQDVVVPVYGRIPPGQDVRAGAYAASVTATINF